MGQDLTPHPRAAATEGRGLRSPAGPLTGPLIARGERLLRPRVWQEEGGAGLFPAGLTRGEVALPCR